MCVYVYVYIYTHVVKQNVPPVCQTHQAILFAFRICDFIKIKHKQPARPCSSRLLAYTLASRAEDTKNCDFNVRPAVTPSKIHGTSARRRAETITEWRNIGLLPGGRLRSSTDCPQMGVPFWERYEDRLFPSDMKSRSRFAALWMGHGQQFARRTGFLG